MLARRWWAWHALWFVAVVGCIWLGVWQFQAAMAPHPPGVDTQAWRNFAYALNWVVFGGVAVWFWWRFIRDQRESELAAAVPPAAAVPRGAAPHADEEPHEVTATEAPPGPTGETTRSQRVFDPFAAAEPPTVDNQSQR